SIAFGPDFGLFVVAVQPQVVIYVWLVDDLVSGDRGAIVGGDYPGANREDAAEVIGAVVGVGSSAVGRVVEGDGMHGLAFVGDHTDIKQAEHLEAMLGRKLVDVPIVLVPVDLAGRDAAVIVR